MTALGRQSHFRFHHALFSSLGLVNARGGVAAPPRNEHAPGYFHAEHHGTAEHQERAAIRARRGLTAESCLRSTITGARTGARGGFSRHRQPFSGGAAHG